MNKNKLKSYAPQARKDFVAAVKARAALLGISEDGISLATKSGDIVIVEGREWPAKVGAQRERLAGKVVKEGFDVVMERVAYTWFNRFAALRYMELHDYLGHGHRVLSNREGGVPEILALAADVELPGLDKARVIELRLAGDRDGDLYRMLLVAQCNALSSAMPFLFERIDDESELLLPDNLLRTDSVVAKMISSIDEEDWSEVEIIGWLYQFYISEKKDEVIGSMVKSEDIPAATQLFTPNWIVKYLVQNSVGRLWLEANPTSSLRKKWKYFVDSSKSDSSVLSRISTLNKLRDREGVLSPETLTVIDPACGSGHILVEAYEVLKDIYLERGYQPRSIPHFILQNNLFGLDIDDRAAQMTGFALLMKARADDRRVLNDPPTLNIYSIIQTTDSSRDFLAPLSLFGVDVAAVSLLSNLFLNGKTYGSLICVPSELKSRLPDILLKVKKAAGEGDLYSKQAALEIQPLIEQALILSKAFDAVITNPPYIGSGYHNPLIKDLAKEQYPDSKADLYSMFMQRCFEYGTPHSIVALMTPFTWLSIKSFEGIRRKITLDKDVICLVQPEYHAFFESAYVPICAFAIRNQTVGANGVYFDLAPYYGADVQAPNLLAAISDANHPQRFEKKTSAFRDLPGSAILFGLSQNAIEILSKSKKIGALADVTEGIKTGDNQRFLRFWPEVDVERTTLLKEGASKWRPHHKGGEYRRWYGNLEHVINWGSDGQEIRENPSSGLQGRTNYFSEGVTWSKLSSSYFGVRLLPKGVLFDSGSPAVFPEDKRLILAMLGFLSSNAASYLIKKLNPTLNFQVGNVSALPFPLEKILPKLGVINEAVSGCVALAKGNWDGFETSWDFQKPALVKEGESKSSLAECFARLELQGREDVGLFKSLEEKNNGHFIELLGLQGELDAAVLDEHITFIKPARGKDCQRLLSYAIGCMMGRYSLDEPGLIYAGSGGAGFDPERYRSFPADADGILPLTDELWFEDDSTLRIVEFLRVVWGKESSEENMEWLAESLGQKSGETPEETVRRYLSLSFYKDHLQTYKKRPIYWLFSSGKQKAFEALVYLHRYNEGTLARMRSEYVVPLLSKYLDRIELLGRDAEAAASGAARTKIQKRIDALRKKHHELVVFEEKLRHTADSRIALDLDEGVKANYSKFGDLLAETKAITGGSED
jgi:hypothetical protein